MIQYIFVRSPWFMLACWVSVVTITSASAQTDAPVKASSAGKRSYRISHETQYLDQVRAEQTLDVLLNGLGKREFLTASLPTHFGDDVILQIMSKDRRLGRVMELLDAMPASEAASAVTEFSKQATKSVEARIQKDIREIPRHVVTLDEISELAKTQPAPEINWYYANHCVIWLVGRYSPGSLVAYETKMQLIAGAATREINKINDELFRQSFTKHISREIYPKLLWANVFRLALLRHGAPIPDDLAYKGSATELEFRKWSAIARLPEVGSGLQGRAYADEDTFEVVSAVRAWPVQDPAEWNRFLSRLRAAVLEQWPTD